MEYLNLRRFKKSHPFSISLNEFVNEQFAVLSEKHDFIFIDSDPYGSYEEMKKDFEENNRMYISRLHSDSSIFGNPVFNHMFRAVHDMQHIELNKGFDPSDELFITYKMVQRYRKLGLSKLDCDLLNIEMAGQVLYYVEHGDFPEDQRAFTIKELEKLGYKVI